MRDALLRLVALDRIDLADLVDLRSDVDTAALERAARAPHPSSLDEARNALAEMHRPGITITDYQEADLRFNAALVAASGNVAMHLVMLSVRGVLVRFIAATQAAIADGGNRLESTMAEHAAILAAVERGDGAAAVHAQDHILGSFRLIDARESRS